MVIPYIDTMQTLHSQICLVSAKVFECHSDYEQPAVEYLFLNPYL